MYLNTAFNENYSVKVYHINGSVVEEFQKNTSEFVVQLKDVESGMYILEINTNKDNQKEVSAK